MARCKENCLHYEACKATYEELTGDSGTGGNAEYCKYFQDRSKFIELPCKVGDTVYLISKSGKIVIGRIAKIIVEIDTSTSDFLLYVHFGKALGQFWLSETSNLYLTKEQAKQALKERNND